MIRLLTIGIYRFCNLEVQYQQSLQKGLQGVNQLIKQYQFNKGSTKLAKIIKQNMPDDQLINDYQALLDYSNICQNIKYQQGSFLFQKLVNLINQDKVEKYLQYKEQIIKMVQQIDCKGIDVDEKEIGDEDKINFLNQLIKANDNANQIHDPQSLCIQICNNQQYIEIPNKITRDKVIKLLIQNNQDPSIIVQYMIHDPLEYQNYFLNLQLHRNLATQLLLQRHKLTKYISDKLRNYVKQYKILNPSNESLELFYTYSKVYFREVSEIENKLYDLLKYLNFQELNSQQLSQLLFIIKSQKNTDLHIQYQDELTKAIINLKQPNEDIVSIFASIMQLNKQSKNVQQYPPFKYLKDYFIQNINKFPSKMINLIEVTNQQMLNKDQDLVDLIEQAAKDGKLDDHLPSLFQYFATLTKRKQQFQVDGLLQKFVENTQVIQIQDGETYQEMCNYISQAIKVGENKQDWMKDVFLKYLNFAQSIDPKQLQHFVHLCIEFNVNNQDKLVEQKMKGLKSMPQVFVLNVILQSQTQIFENTKNTIKQYLLNTDYESQVKELSKDAIVYTLFTASLDKDMTLFEKLYDRFVYQIRSLIDTFINANSQAGQVRKANLQMMQLFQSFIHYQIHTGKVLYDEKFKDIVYQSVQNNIFQHPSFNEDKIAVYLQERNIKYEQNKFIGPYSVDFYLPEYDKIIEAFGAQHFIGGNLRQTDVLRLKFIGKPYVILKAYEENFETILDNYLKN